MSLIPTQIAEEKFFDESITSSIEDFDTVLQQTFKPETYEKLKTIGAFIMQGLSFTESCILARIDPNKMKDIIKTNDAVASFFSFKETAYKAMLLKVMSGRAKDGEVKIAGWLLERKYPKEFNAKAPAAEDLTGDHLLEQGVQFIRSAGDAAPLVKPTVKVIVDKNNPLSPLI